MKGPRDSEPYQLDVGEGESVLAEPGEYFQLINSSKEPSYVLYIVSPAYVFEKIPDGPVVYDDSVVLDDDWNTLAASNWRPSKPIPTDAQRNAAAEHLRQRKGAIL
jgi:hypothetical protein